MIQPHYEQYRYTTEIGLAETASIVECRLPSGEVGNILAVRASLLPRDCACADGEIQYGGKLVLHIVYEEDGRVCRTERGAEFTHRLEDSRVTPSCFAYLELSAENISHRREGSSVYISVVAGAKCKIFAERETEYLSGGENVIVKREEQTFVKTLTSKGMAEADDEFEIDYVGDILLHAENVYASSAEANAGFIVVAGEISLQFCALKEDGGICSYERLIPFRSELSCEECSLGAPVAVRANVSNAQLNITADEEKGKCKVDAQIDLALFAEVYVKEKLTTATDVFSPLCEVSAVKQTETRAYCAETMAFTERVSGVASLSEKIDYSTAIKAVLLPKAELVCKNGEAEGAIEADVILKDKDGNLSRAKMTLPFLFSVRTQEGAYFQAEAIVCGISLRQKKEGEAEAEATLKAVIKRFEEQTATYIAKTEEGEEYGETDAAISVYLPREGDGLWETAKRFHRDPDELQKNNPELSFPLKGNERIFVYRQKN